MPDRFTYDVFLSHNSKDKPRVRKLAEELRAAGLRVWFDEWVIKAGDDIYLAIERGLEAARVQVLCLSPAALGSEWVALERSTVLFRDPTNAGRRFIPLLLADCELPDALRRYKYIDYRQNEETALAELLTACRFELVLASPSVDIKSTNTPAQRTERAELMAVQEGKLTGHTGWIQSLEFSPDGKWIVSGSRDKKVKIWDLDTGICRATLRGHLGGVESVAITPDGKRILSASTYHKFFRIWDASSGQELARINGHIDYVWSVVALRDNTRALSGGRDSTLRLWDLATGSCLKTIECGTSQDTMAHSLAINPAGTRSLSCHFSAPSRLWDLNTGECLVVLKGHSGPVASLQFTPDGQLAVSGSYDKTVKIWDLETGACIQSLEGHQRGVNSVAISPDGALIASAGGETVRLWDLSSGACLQIIRNKWPKFDPWSVAFSPDGARIAVGTAGEEDRAIYFYRLTGATVS